MKRRTFIRGSLLAIVPAGEASAAQAVGKDKKLGPPDKPLPKAPLIRGQATTTEATTKIAQFPSSADGYSALDYGGFCVSPAGDALLFGGGHAATAIPDVWRLAGGSNVWVSDYAVPTRDQVIAAWATPRLTPSGWLNLPGFPLLPATVHAYSGNVWSHAINRMLKCSVMAGGYSGGTFGFVNQSIGEYDPVTKTWADTGVVPPWPGTIATAEDPISGNIIFRQDSWFGVYDPRARKIIAALQQTSPVMAYDDHMVYYPPTDKFYYITRGYATLNPPCPHVIELALDRKNWTHSLRELPFTRTPTSPKAEAGALAYAYDPDSQMIVGGLDGGYVHGFHPERGWFQHEAPTGAATDAMYFHHWAYDEKNNRHIVIQGYGGIGQTWSFRGSPAKWQPMKGIAPDVVAKINGGAFGNLEDACNAAVPLTIGEGVLRKGGAVTFSGTTSIVGAGMDKTHLIGAVVWGKGEIVVSAKSAIRIADISFEDAAVADQNGAGLRHESGSVVLDQCAFRRNQMGYLSGGPTHSATLRRCSFEDSGTNVASPSIGHGAYIGHNCTDAVVEECQFRGTIIGHHLKSRAIRTTVGGCRFDASSESYCIDLPWGGEVAISNCTMTQGAETDNDVMVNYGGEGFREAEPVPFPKDSFAMTDCLLTSNGVPHAVGLRFDTSRYPNVAVTLTRVQFVGIETPVAGGIVTFKDCSKDGVPIPNSDGTMSRPPSPRSAKR